MNKKEELTAEQIAELKAAYDAIDRRAHFGGIFGIESAANEDARRVKLEKIKEGIEQHDRGYEGAYRKCPTCGGKQKYKGAATKELEFDCGKLTIQRAYYHCAKCKSTSFPLDEKLGLVEGQEQGILREKLCMLAILSPYNQASQVCKTLLGSESYAMNLSRIVNRESSRFESRENDEKLRNSGKGDRVYIEIDGHMCPTREKRRNADDNGYREAKVILGFCEKDVTQMTSKRREILAKTMRAKVTDVAGFRPLFEDVYKNVNGDHLGELVVIADGAKWIWNLIDELAPHATQILDYAHAKQHLWDAAKLMYGEQNQLAGAWVAKQQDLLFEDHIDKVIENISQFIDIVPALQTVASYFERNASRMKYKSYRERNLNIGSGAIESAGKQISAGRIKGPGMRWSVTNLNKLLALRCSFLDGSWRSYWAQTEKIAA